MEAFSCTEKQHPHADLVTDASFELQVATQAFWQSFGDRFPHTSDQRTMHEPPPSHLLEYRLPGPIPDKE
jgi:hypothetical protein